MTFHIKCLVHGCPNQMDEGGFTGVFCTPCHNMIKTGVVGHGETFIHKMHRSLVEIRDHWANQYDHIKKETDMYKGAYGIGITDGHRLCAQIARKGLGEKVKE